MTDNSYVPSFSETTPETIFCNSLVKTKAWSRTVSYYRDLGYDVSHGDYLMVSVLVARSRIRVNVICPLCKKKRSASLDCIQRSGHSYCQGCSQRRDYRTVAVSSGIKFIKPVLEKSSWHWVCKCGICGKEFISRANCIISGLVNSCSCLQKKAASIMAENYYKKFRDKPRNKHPRFIDLTGQVYGSLRILRYFGLNKHEQTMWTCLCKCGNKTIVSTNSLRSGSVKTCGCASKGKGHPAYNPSLTDEERRKRRSEDYEYKSWKRFIKNRDKVCVICGSSKKLNVHHLFCYRKYKNLRKDTRNGVLLCKKHHSEFHQGYMGNYRTPCTGKDFLLFVKKVFPENKIEIISYLSKIEAYTDPSLLALE